MKTFTTTVTALSFAGNAVAFWRMPCRSYTGIARIDPLVAPNNVADHSHIVFGGGSEFGRDREHECFCAHPLTLLRRLWPKHDL
jgi:hypothetical protein